MDVPTIVLAVLSIGAFFFVIGYVVADDRASAHDHAERKKLKVQRQLLDTEWKALKQASRINDVFFAARDQMRQAEAEAGGYGTGRRGQPGSGYGPRVVDGQWQ